MSENADALEYMLASAYLQGLMDAVENDIASRVAPILSVDPEERIGL